MLYNSHEEYRERSPDPVVKAIEDIISEHVAVILPVLHILQP